MRKAVWAADMSASFMSHVPCSAACFIYGGQSVSLGMKRTLSDRTALTLLLTVTLYHTLMSQRSDSSPVPACFLAPNNQCD